MTDVPAPERTLGYAVLYWAEKWLLQPDGPHAGEAWRFTPEQAAFILNLYAIDADGRFIHRRAVFRRSKGHGKSPLMAVIAASELCGPCRFGGFDAQGMPLAICHPAPWVQVIAVSLEQTKNTCGLFPALFSADAVREDGLEIGKERVYSRAGGRIEAVTSSPKSLEGGRPSMVIEDETGLWVTGTEGPEMNRVSERNLAKSRGGQALLVESSNAHLIDEGSVAEMTYEAVRRADGNLPGVLYDALEAPVIRGADGEPIPLAELTDDQIREGLLVARGDSTWVDVERLLREIRDPKTGEGMARRFYLNQPTLSAFEEWIPASAWQACARPDIEVPDGAHVVLGVDGSYNSDSTAIVAATIEPVPHLFVVAIWEPDPKALYDELQTVPILDVEEVGRQACRRWRVKEIACDPHLLQRTMAVWAGERLPVLEVPQTERMIDGAAVFRQAVLNHQLTHSGDPRLSRHMANVVVRETYVGLRLVKESRRTKRKIDLAIAATMAYDRARGGVGVAEGWLQYFRNETAKQQTTVEPVTPVAADLPATEARDDMPPSPRDILLGVGAPLPPRPSACQHRWKVEGWGTYCVQCSERREN